MKKTITSVLTLAIAAVSLPVTALAADHSDPVTKHGVKLKYNTSYYLKDKNLSHKGGVTFESWYSHDYVRFTDSSTDNGTPIIFENKDRTDGFIKSDDEIRIKSTKANWDGWQYWTPGGQNDSIYLSNDDKTEHIIYGSSTDNSIGIATPFTEYRTMGTMAITSTPGFNEYKGENTEKAWMKSDWSPLRLPPLNNRQTPLEVIEVNE